MARQPVRKSQTESQRLLTLQKQIQATIQKDLDRLLGKPSAAIQAYQRQYDRDLESTKTRISIPKSRLIEKIRKTDVTLVGDFHTFYQSQRTFLRLARECVKRKERWYLGIEFVPSHFQDALDSFQDGALSLAQFHERISYGEEWGFPWANYAPIFDWARENGVRLIALNRPKEISRSSASLRSAESSIELKERDRWAAGLITDRIAEDRKERVRARFLVLFGELHLSHSHLPAQIEEVSRRYLGKALSCISIHQNNESVYWKLATRKKEHSVDALQLSPAHYCVISATPWAKLQSLVDWLEDGALDLTPDDHGAEADYLSSLQSYGRIIATSLSMAPASFDTISVQSIRDIDFIDWLEKEPFFSRRELMLIKQLILSNQKVYIPRSEIAFVGSISHNGLAQLAAVHLLRFHNRDQRIFETRPDDFSRLVLEQAFGFFGSLLVNPRRKCDLEEDHRAYLKTIRDRRGKLDQRERVAREAALQVLRLTRDHPSRIPNHPCVLRLTSSFGAGPSAFLASKYVGKILGKKLHLALIKGKARTEDIRSLFFEPVHGPYRYSNQLARLCVLVSGIVLEPTKKLRI